MHKNKYKNKITWFIDRLFSYLFNFLINYILKKDYDKVLFGLKPAPYEKDFFFHNSKYLFLEMHNSKTRLKTLWLCDDNNMLKEFRLKGINNVASRKSLKGIWWILTSKYWVCDITINQVSRFNSSNTNITLINFWHGAGGLKKVGYDACENQLQFKKNNFQDKIYNLLKKTDDYFVTNSDFESQCRESAFGAKSNQIIKLVSP